MKFWIIRHYHRFGDSCWPVWKETEPDLKWLLETDTEFASDYEGEGAPDREEGEGREDEGIEVYGPFPVPGLCAECEIRQHSP